MGIAERRARHRQSLRQDIIAAARTMFADEGYDRVSMRRLARKIDYSPTAIYLHFKDKDALFQAVSDETFDGLIKRLARHRERYAGRPMERLRAGLREYIDFGLAHPEHYTVTFMLRTAAASSPDFEKSVAREAFGHLAEAVADCVAAGLTRPLAVDAASQALWASVHGVVSLRIAKPGFPFVARHALTDELLDTLIAGLRP